MASLLDPLKVGRLELRNRIVMPPMHFDKATKDGLVTEENVKHYVDRASKLGLQIVEATTVSKTNRWFYFLSIDSDRFITGLKTLVKRVHQVGTPIALQLVHFGGLTIREKGLCKPMAPSSIAIPGKSVSYSDNEIPKTMTADDIEEVVGDFSNAARRACEAGFDAIEIHGAHGFLFTQFLSSLTNKREDEYGGSLENRVRFSVRVIRRIKKELGSNYPILYRLGAEDMLQGGLTLDEGIRAAKMIVDAGADIIDVSGGLVGWFHPENKGPGFFVPQAAAVKKAVDVPVIGVGGIKTPEEADDIIGSGKVDLIAIGRTIIKDPHWASRAIEMLTKK
jgi:2,4-dienoyl-CoA reductase-like NADH-dependent reductase (Old Yellow Enzyme family)